MMWLFANSMYKNASCALYRKRYIRVVIFQITFQNVLTWTQHTFKPLSIQSNAFQRSSRHHCGSTRAVVEQGDFTKVVTWSGVNSVFNWFQILCTLVQVAQPKLFRQCHRRVASPRPGQRWSCRSRYHTCLGRRPPLLSSRNFAFCFVLLTWLEGDVLERVGNC